jgi:hypothetical protein
MQPTVSPPSPCVLPHFFSNSLLNDISYRCEREGFSREIDLKNLVRVSLLQSEESSKREWNLPTYCLPHSDAGCDGLIPLNALEIPKNLQHELGSNIMDWFYQFATNNIPDYKAPEVPKYQPVAQATSYIAACMEGIQPKMHFSLVELSPRETWIILRYNLEGTKYDNFVLTSEKHFLEKDCISFGTDDVMVTVGILLMKEPMWSIQKKWEDTNYGFALRGHFIAWGKYVRVSPQRENVKGIEDEMIAQCSKLHQASFLPSLEELRVNMLARIGFNTLLKPQVITSKSVSLLALDFTCMVSYTESGGLRVCGQDVRFFSFYKVASYLSEYPDLFTFSKGGGKLNTLDPRKITLYHFDEVKKVYVLFEIALLTKDCFRIQRYVKPEDLKDEGIEKRAMQYLC